MKIPTLTFAAVALASLSGCGEYYYQGRGATSYGSSGVAYNDPQAINDPNVAVSADGRPVTGQDVYVGASTAEYTDTDPAALSDFRTTLDPYGSWVDDGTYGTVWVPSTTVVGSDFVPYVSAGHWTYGNDYTWVSNYDWGWAPFHYGRWVYINGRGWSWIPGRTYSSAWVTWRSGYDGWGYVGWAPMPPTWYWHSGVAVGIGVVPVAPYTFCASGDVFAPSVATRVVGGQQVAVVAQHTRPFTPATPTVGDRTPATPTVGGTGSGLGPQRMGPPPSTLGLTENQIQRAPASDRGLLRAEQFSHPSTATLVGARPPISSMTAATNTNGTFRPSTTVATSPVYSRPYGTPDYRPTPLPQTYQPTQTYRPAYQPSQQPAQAYHPYQPSYAPTPSYSPPSYSPPAHAYAPTYSPPSYSPPARSYSPPSYSPQTSGGSFAPSVSPSFGGSRPSFSGGRPSVGGRR